MLRRQHNWNWETIDRHLNSDDEEPEHTWTTGMSSKDMDDHVFSSLA